MNATRQPSAAQTYAARRADIARLMDVLAMELEAHDANAKGDAGNWGYVGNLGKIRADLIGAVGFISNQEPESVEAFLADAAD